MGDSDWLRVKELVARALEQSPDQRSAVLDEACAGDPALREEVESLLRAAAASGTFLEQPAIALFQGRTEVEQRLREAGPHDSNVGRTLGPYCIERSIGHGGMGTVYLARRADEEFERRVAIKMIRRGMDSDLMVRRFRHERQILASLDHPHIASLFDGGTTPEGLPYLVMEHVTGTAIDRYADEHRLTTLARLRLCLDVLDAVQHAHERQVVHRDLKPSNVLVTADGHPKLLDFGIAKLLDPGAEGPTTFTSLARPMTPHYASPEQVRGDPVTPASDVYALGILLYELLTGHRPYRLTTGAREEMVRVVCEQDPERPSAVINRIDTTPMADGTIAARTPATVSGTRDGSPEALRRRLAGDLDEIVLKALRKEPDRRYATAGALADDLRRYLAEQPVAARRDALRYRATRFVRRHRLALGGTALVAVVVAMTALVAVRVTSERSVPSSDLGAVIAPLVAPRPSLAVAGFGNLSQRPADQWLSAALAEMLTTELAGDGQLRVVPADRVARLERDLGGDDDRLRVALATDYVARGTFAVSDGAPPRSLRIDVRVHHASGDPIAVSGIGDEARIFSTLAEAGRELRGRLKLRESPREVIDAARAAFPRSLEATRLYAEGIARLRLVDPVAARDLLEQASAREPDNPLIHTALASAWAGLGYDAKAQAAAGKAFDASRALNREDRLNVEGRFYEAQRQWPKAVDVYHTLWGFFSDNVEYGLRLAAAQTSAGRGNDAITTVDAMRRLPAPQNGDPRIDLAEAEAAAALGDFRRELAAIQRAARTASQAGSRLLVARARLLEGRSYFNQGQPIPAEQSLEAARRMFAEVGDRAGVASALNSLANVLGDQQDISRAQSMFEQSLATSEAIGDRRGMSAALNNLGTLLKDQRRFVEARQAHERSLGLRREIGDRNWTAVSLANIGVVLFEQDQLREAATYYNESLAICRETGDKRGHVRALHNLALVEQEVGDLPAARARFEDAFTRRAEINDKRGGAMGRVALGSVLLAQGELDAARRTEQEGLQMAREARFKPGEAQAEFQLGEIAVAAGDLKAARGHHEHALALRGELKETRTILESEVALAELAFDEGRTADAEREARRLAQSLGREPVGPLLFAVDLLTARVRLARGDVEAAGRMLATVQPWGRRTERIEPRRALTMVEAELEAARGRAAEGRARLVELGDVLERSGMVLADLERRMLTLEIDRAEGRASLSADANALEKDARARGMGLMVRRVQALAASASRRPLEGRRDRQR